MTVILATKQKNAQLVINKGGVAGPAGPAGPIGPQGATGTVGSTGPQGAQGAAGIGTQGSQGAIGATGSAGLLSTGIVAGTYGGASNVAVITVAANGLLFFAGNAAVAGVSNFQASGNTFTITTSSGASFLANIQPNSVRLSTDTSGSYVANLVAGTGVSLLNLGDEGTTPTIAIGQDVGTSNNVVFANITSNYNVTVNANLSFNLVDAGEY